LEINKKDSKEIKKELADKVELIRTIAEFNGFALQDLINEADRKKGMCKNTVIYIAVFTFGY